VVAWAKAFQKPKASRDREERARQTLEFLVRNADRLNECYDAGNGDESWEEVARESQLV